MLAELLEQDHRQKRRLGPAGAARRDMERRRRLGDRLAPPAGEPLPNGLDHLPLTGDNLERLRMTSSPSFDSFVEPQQGQHCGAAITIGNT